MTYKADKPHKIRRCCKLFFLGLTPQKVTAKVAPDEPGSEPQRLTAKFKQLHPQKKQLGSVPFLKKARLSSCNFKKTDLIRSTGIYLALETFSTRALNS